MKYSERQQSAEPANRRHFIVMNPFRHSGNSTSYDNDSIMKICLYMNSK